MIFPLRICGIYNIRIPQMEDTHTTVARHSDLLLCLFLHKTFFMDKQNKPFAKFS